MKGILKETKEGWVVWYIVAVDETTSINIKETLPLYPDTVTDNLFYGKEVEFEITDEFTHQHLYKGVGWGDGIKYAKLINIETWDEIFKKYPVFENGRYRSLKQYLSENYNVPNKK